MDDPTTENVTEGFGLMHYNARMYDPALGRFISADTIIPSTQGVQGWDRYAYVNNSPVMYSDSTGHCMHAMMMRSASSRCGGGGGGSGGSSTKPPAQSPQAEGDSLVNPDHCKKFGECDSVPSSNGSVTGKGPGLNTPTNNNGSLCPYDAIYCKEMSLTHSQLDDLHAMLSNMEFAYWLITGFFGILSASSATIAALAGPAMLIGIPVAPVAAIAAGVFGVAAAGFGFEAYSLGQLAGEIKNIRDTINPGESIKVAYFQQKDDFGPGLTYEGRNSNYGFGITSINGILVLKSIWGIP